MKSSAALRLIVSALLILVFTGHAFAAEVLVAAASDLNFPIKEIISQFEQKTGNTVKLTLGSSGSFQAHIANGAPFDVYLSADVDYVRQLERAGLIEPGSLYVYAVGRLVIWVPNASPIDIQKLGMDSLLQPSAKRIAIANPAVAPYGRAAVAALRHFSLYRSERVAYRCPETRHGLFASTFGETRCHRESRCCSLRQGCGRCVAPFQPL